MQVLVQQLNVRQSQELCTNLPSRHSGSIRATAAPICRYVLKCLEKNRHNHATTAYFLLLSQVQPSRPCCAESAKIVSGNVFAVNA